MVFYVLIIEYPPSAMKLVSLVCRIVDPGPHSVRWPIRAQGPI